MREREARPAGGAEGALPSQTLVEQGVLVAGAAPPAHDRELAGELVGQPLTRLGPERIVLGRVPQGHAEQPSQLSPPTDASSGSVKCSFSFEALPLVRRHAEQLAQHPVVVLTQRRARPVVAM